MTGFICRNTTKNDIEQLQSLMIELGYHINKTELLDRMEEIKLQGNKLIVIEENSVIIGVVQALIDIRLAEGKVGEIVSLVVSSKSRGKGVGKTLLTQAKEFLIESGCTSFRVRANVKREDAHQFYKALGFKELKTQMILEYKNV